MVSDNFYILCITKMTKLIPLEDGVLVEAIQEETTTKSGIILPDSDKKPNKWVVVSVGKWKILDNGQRAPIDVKVWDVVYFTAYSPDEIELEWKKYLIIRQNNLLAKEE